MRCQALSGVMCKTFILYALILAEDKAVPGNKHTRLCVYAREVQMFVLGVLPVSYYPVLGINT